MLAPAKQRWVQYFGDKSRPKFAWHSERKIGATSQAAPASVYDRKAVAVISCLLPPNKPRHQCGSWPSMLTPHTFAKSQEGQALFPAGWRRVGLLRWKWIRFYASLSLIRPPCRADIQSARVAAKRADGPRTRATDSLRSQPIVCLFLTFWPMGGAFRPAYPAPSPRSRASPFSGGRPSPSQVLWSAGLPVRFSWADHLR